LFGTIEKWIDTRIPVLVADDLVDNRKLIDNYFQKSREHNYNVIFAENGKEAVEIFKQRTISLILMDMEMPVMNGYEATKAIRKLEGGADIPIIAMTAHEGVKQIKETVEKTLLSLEGIEEAESKLVSEITEEAFNWAKPWAGLH